MYYSCRELSKEDIENQIKNAFKVRAGIKGHFSKAEALDTILFFAFCNTPWNEMYDCPARRYTIGGVIGVRYYLNSPGNNDVVYNPLTKEEALLLCEKILNNMANKNIVTISELGEEVKYIG